jgi:ankyrin repeat protein
MSQFFNPNVRLLVAALTCCLCLMGSPALAQSPASLPHLVKANDIAAVEKALTRANAGSVDEEGDPLLMNAALYASAEMMELLLRKGADPNAKNRDGETALMWAVPDKAKLALLLKHGADVNSASASGNTALHIACVGADTYGLVKLLMDHGADPLLRNGRKETALMRTALFGDTATLSALVKAGNEVDAMDSTGLTALINAIFNVNRAATVWLLNNGADPDKVGAFGLTAVTAVVTYNDVPSVAAVLSKAKNINTVDSLGISALMWAAYNEHDNPAIIQALLDKGADVQLKAKNGDTALSWALKKGNTKTGALLRKAGAQ